MKNEHQGTQITVKLNGHLKGKLTYVISKEGITHIYTDLDGNSHTMIATHTEVATELID